MDTVLIAVGLAEVNEFYLKAKQWGMDVFSAGDAQEIAEASAAMFTGKIEGFKIAESLGLDVGEIPVEWDEKATILKTKPGTPVKGEEPKEERRVCLSPFFTAFRRYPVTPALPSVPSARSTLNETRSQACRIGTHPTSAPVV